MDGVVEAELGIFKIPTKPALFSSLHNFRHPENVDGGGALGRISVEQLSEERAKCEGINTTDYGMKAGRREMGKKERKKERK